jgi:hypothetical protein
MSGQDYATICRVLPDHIHGLDEIARIPAGFKKTRVTATNSMLLYQLK